MAKPKRRLRARYVASGRRCLQCAGLFYPQQTVCGVVTENFCSEQCALDHHWHRPSKKRAGEPAYQPERRASSSLQETTFSPGNRVIAAPHKKVNEIKGRLKRGSKSALKKGGHSARKTQKAQEAQLVSAQ